jgi:hypothetical protein
LFGSKNGTPDVSDAPINAWPTGGRTHAYSWSPVAGTQGSYVRYARFYDAAGTTLCVSDPVVVTIE